MWRQIAIHNRSVALFSDSIASLQMENMQHDIHEELSSEFQYQKNENF